MRDYEIYVCQPGQGGMWMHYWIRRRARNRTDVIADVRKRLPRGSTAQVVKEDPWT